MCFKKIIIIRPAIVVIEIAILSCPGIAIHIISLSAVIVAIIIVHIASFIVGVVIIFVVAVFLLPTHLFVADPPRVASPRWLLAMAQLMLVQQNPVPFSSARAWQSAPPTAVLLSLLQRMLGLVRRPVPPTSSSPQGCFHAVAGQRKGAQDGWRHPTTTRWTTLE